MLALFSQDLPLNFVKNIIMNIKHMQANDTQLRQCQ